MKNKWKLLNYQLNDALELNFSKKPLAIKAVKEILANHMCENSSLWSNFCFAVEDVLVVIQNRLHGKMNYLYLLNSKKGSVELYSIGAVLKEEILNGKFESLLKA